jgi:hypothetical protein
VAKPMCIDCGEREQQSRQLCRRCGQRWRRAGRELPSGPRNRQTWDQVVADVTRGRTNDDCWPWTKATSPDGYAVGGSQFGTSSASRAMFIHFTGEDLSGKRLRNLCHDTDPDCINGPGCSHRRCVNPAHYCAEGVQALPSPGELQAPCIDCGKRERTGYQLCSACRRRWRRRGWDLPQGERNRQTWEEILADVMRGRTEDECWPWAKALTEQGYGVNSTTGFKTGLAHRAVFIHFTGQDITGLELDHLCHNEDPDCLGGPKCLHRRCVNYRHLQLVSGAENLARRKSESMASGAAKRVAQKTHCSNGHELTEENIYWFRNKRLCRICRKNSRTRTEAKRKARTA